MNASIGDLLATSRDLPVQQSFEQHTKVIDQTIALISDVGDQSNLTLDPDLDSYEAGARTPNALNRFDVPSAA